LGDFNYDLISSLKETKMTISHNERIYLKNLKVCYPTDRDPEEEIDSRAPRVLVPEWHSHLFVGLTKRGGAVLAIKNLREEVAKIAKLKLGRPYGRSRASAPDRGCYSCSSFVKEVFAMIGIHLPKYAIDQSYCGSPMSEAQIGDLLFFEGKFPLRDYPKAVGHVAIKIEKDEMIHALDQAGSVITSTAWTLELVSSVIPSEPHVLIMLPSGSDFETALDVARWRQKRV
jgi:cell wall-associated NlpC family hydrolase